ncbi:MAG: glycosyltransferase family 4 protein [Acidobacteria bacterium]|nr:glycosyltransferase family 4 protein [Acidobacteriota bacterium]
MAVHQFLAGFARGDAISSEAVAIQRAVRSFDPESSIYVWPDYLDPSVAGHAHSVGDYLPSPRHTLIYHFSIGSPVSRLILDWPGRKLMLYHNITPDHYLSRYSSTIADELRRGRDELRHLSECFDTAIAHSEYSRLELEQNGYRNTAVIPFLLNPDNYNIPPDPKMKSLFDDDQTNVFFVGRIVPNKCPHDLLKVFHAYQRINPPSRLLLIGGHEALETYFWRLQHLVKVLSLRNVFFLGHVSQAELLALYETGDVFVSMSEHEGFCVPIVECFMFKIPVIAYGAASIPETAGDAALLVQHKDWREIAELINRVQTDSELRQRQVTRGEERFQTLFAPDIVRHKWTDLINSVKPECS